MSRFHKMYRKLGGSLPPAVLFQIAEALTNKPQPGSESAEEIRVNYLKTAIPIVEKEMGSEIAKKYKASVEAYRITIGLAKAAKKQTTKLGELPSLKAAAQNLSSWEHRHKIIEQQQRQFAEKMMKEEMEKKKK